MRVPDGVKPARRAITRRVLEIAAVGLAYVLTAKLGLMMDAVAGFASVVWPPTGIALASLLLLGDRVAPAVAAGAFISNLWGGAHAPVALGIALGNTLEAFAGAHLLRRSGSFDPHLRRVQDVLVLVVGSATVSTLLSASVGVTSLVAGGVLAPAGAREAFVAWWLGDMVGALVVAPLLLLWTKALVPPAHARGTLAEGALLFALVAAACAWVFLPRHGANAGPVPLKGVYVFFPLLIWAALRLGQRATTTITFTLSAVAIACTATGRGPFAGPSLYPSLLAIQSFIAVAAATFLVLGAFVAERHEALASLRSSDAARARLVTELERAVRARDAVISMASHELRNPLSALKLQLHALGRSLRDDAPDEGAAERAESRLVPPNRQIARLARLVDDLLDVSRINAGRLRVQLEQVDLTATVREVLERAEEEVRQGASTIQLYAGTAQVGRWDRARLEQVATNLVSNASKYGNGGPIEITVEGDEASARLVVADHGIGIAEEDQARIFEPFERVAPEHTASGFGLGLWIVRQVVQALGGAIRVESRLGQGSTFTVELPKAGPAPRSEEQDAAELEPATSAVSAPDAR